MMVLFKNADITIYNHCYDNENAYDVYKRTNIKGVNWQSKRNATVSDKGVNVADSTLIFIDKLDNYVSPRRFNLLCNEERKNKFTFEIGDKIVKGSIDFELSNLKPHSLADLQNNFDNVVTIVAIRELSNHWEVECK
ncbi:hypothetical protein HYH38_08300 [Clostridium botulinum]|nr:hypothetical protein [Clostridium botulinum]MBY6827280.1 hypothetical protein [Clostridium botulinum]MBY6859228.1 hypothetical protein [Clostridium botulinum]MBY7041488.1 hypothetical protein [Clostridium botulinum]